MNPLEDPRFLLFKNVEQYLRLTPYEKVDFDLLIERLKEVRDKKKAAEKEAV